MLREIIGGCQVTQYTGTYSLKLGLARLHASLLPVLIADYADPTADRDAPSIP